MILIYFDKKKGLLLGNKVAGIKLTIQLTSPHRSTKTPKKLKKFNISTTQQN
jgi:hypothetical protein